MSPSLQTHAKARRYLLRELVSASCGEGGLEITVIADTGTWRVALDGRGRPRCNCPARRRRCAHVVIFEMLTNGRPK